MNSASLCRTLLMVAAPLLLASCGGGGGSAPPPTFAVGGTVTAFTGTLKLLNNGGDVLTVTGGATTFKFLSALLNGAAYGVTISAQPPGQLCTVSNGSGAIGSAPVSNISITCGPGAVSSIASFDPATAPNGSQPTNGVIQASDGNFYGTTYNGGTNNTGTVFKVTPAGQVSTLYSFGAAVSNDAQHPQSALLQASDGNLYGTTAAGGVFGNGTVFRLSLAGTESVLHSFAAAPDGAAPAAALIQASDGNLYGTTRAGGSAGAGTVFKLSLLGVETVLHSFGVGTDGVLPLAPLLIGSDGNLYGTTYQGGANGFGTVYQITLGGAETVEHSFGAAQDGRKPQSGLLLGPDGAYYGTVAEGAANATGGIYRFALATGESMLYAFGPTSGADGRYPLSGLTLASDGAFYGVTSSGGTHNRGSLFRLTLAGTESVLYSFGATGDGQIPLSDLLLASNGVFYGTTSAGGSTGNGAVFNFN